MYISYNGLVQIQKDYAHKHLNYSLQRIGSETFIPEDESIDFVFTSIYCTLVGEAYGDELEQSSIKFSTSDMWKEKF